MKLYLDIVVKITRRVIALSRMPDPGLSLSLTRRLPLPETRRSARRADQTAVSWGMTRSIRQRNFAHLTARDYAYTPYVPQGEQHAKVPDWLNDPIYYTPRQNRPSAARARPARFQWAR